MAPLRLAVLCALVGAGASGDACADAETAETAEASLLQFARIAVNTLTEGEMAARALVMEQEASGLDLADPGTPPCCGSDLDMTMLLEDHNAQCETVFLTTLLATRKDPQSKIYGPPDFSYFQRYWRSILALPAGAGKAVIMHDYLPDNVTSNYSTKDGSVSFVKVDISGFDPLLGLNDLRYQLFEQQVKNHPDWDTVFLTDISDVVVLHNPCAFVERQPERVFVGSQHAKMKPYKFIRDKFLELGGKYLEWYDAQPDDHYTMLNAGILGGKRSMVLAALERMNAVVTDPELASRKAGEPVRVNMAAFNYVFYTAFANQTVTGHPLHSQFSLYDNRTDVYFRHK